MSRFVRVPSAALTGAILGSLVLVFVADLYTPLGIAVWVFYLVPIVLTFFGAHPTVPIVSAAAVSVVLPLGYALSAPGIDPGIARLNRSFLFATAWALSALGYYFVRNRLALREQEWLQRARAHLSAQMSGEPSLEDLGRQVLRVLTGLLDAPAGALYVERGGRYDRVATVGVPAETTVPSSLAAHEGLLGRAISDQRPIVVADVPAGYFEFGSALGRATPRHLLVAPVKVHASTCGVVEIATSTVPYASDLTLLAEVSEPIAVAIRSAEYRAERQRLLEETQRQAEELQAQTEELSAQNEELEAQRAALEVSQASLEAQQAELEQTNTQLEEQAATLEAQRDDVAKAKDVLELQAGEIARASRYKSEFLANMSHELRTPLNSALILARLLGENRDGVLREEHVQYARTIESAGEDLLSIINDVLDLAKVEAGQMGIDARPTPISAVIERMRAIFAPMAAEKHLTFDTVVAPTAPATIDTDDRRVEQVLRNLLANAVKFTTTGAIQLTVTGTADEQVAFAVSDTGIGIPSDALDRIFEPFIQANGSISRTHGGTGLGLSISRELVRLLGGRLEVRSAPGEGSTFTMTLPARPDTSATLTQPEVRETGSGIRALARVTQPRAVVPDDRDLLTPQSRTVLIVEDDVAFARILGNLAREQGFQPLIATSSTEALDLAAQHHPSAILLDVALPDNSGLAVLDQLKADTRTRHTPVHVVSAYDYVEHALSLGAVGCVLKPVKRDELVAIFRRLEQRLTERPRRVLIVEHDARRCESLDALLRAPDVEVLTAEGAALALGRLRTTTVDCLVLDLTLPGASGFELLQTLSREERYAFPPVIVYTERELSIDEEQRLRRYARSVIIKSARSPARLLDEVTLFLHRVVSDLPAEQRALLATAHSNATLDGRRVLVVEDDVRNVYALTSVLESRGVDVTVARNGREALDALARSADRPAERIDLVLMDVMMPEMDGLTATRAIRQQPAWARLPIIALTAKAMRDDQEQALRAGASDYLAKPLDSDQLLSLLRIWMPR